MDPPRVNFEIRRRTPEEQEVYVKDRERERREQNYQRQLAEHAKKVEKKRAQETGSMVYILECAGVHKIGMSCDVAGRVRGIQGMCPRPLTLVFSAKGGRRKEMKLHRLFHHKNTHGEWFDLDADEVKAVIKEMKKT